MERYKPFTEVYKTVYLVVSGEYDDHKVDFIMRPRISFNRKIDAIRWVEEAIENDKAYFNYDHGTSIFKEVVHVKVDALKNSFVIEPVGTEYRIIAIRDYFYYHPYNHYEGL